LPVNIIGGGTSGGNRLSGLYAKKAASKKGKNLHGGSIMKKKAKKRPLGLDGFPEKGVGRKGN